MTAPRNTRHLRARLLASLALVALLAPVSAAEAKKLKMGVHSQNSLNASEIQRMGEGNVSSLRMIFRWSQVEPDPNEPANWALLDFVMTQASASGVDVLPVILGTPAWASDNAAATSQQGAQAWPTNAFGAARLQQFIAAVVDRYGRGGTFWEANPSLTPRAITEYQLWNEPNRPLFSPGGTPAPAVYAEFLRTSYGTIKSFDPKAQVLLAGMPERTTTSKPLDKYLKGFYKVKGVEKIFDIMTLHPYGVDQKGAEGAVLRMRQLLKKVGDKKRELWITEFGWGSGGEASPFTKSAADQGKLLAKTAKLFKKKQKKYRLGAMFWFSWRDRIDPGGSGTWQDHTGLFKRDGGRKPAWKALTDFTGGDPGAGSIDDPLGFPLGTQNNILRDLLASKPAG